MLGSLALVIQRLYSGMILSSVAVDSAVVFAGERNGALSGTRNEIESR